MTKNSSIPLSSEKKQELINEINYLCKISASSLGRLLQGDLASIAIRHELEQKRRGFRLMADLAMTLRTGTDYESVFISVSRRINAALNMQRTAVLFPIGQNNRFKVSILQGYPQDDAAKIKSMTLVINSEFLTPNKPVLITAEDPITKFQLFREVLDLPFFISVPVLLNGEVKAILVTGRQQEQLPFSPRLGSNDVETVQTVGSYLSAMLTGQLLEKEEAQRHDLEEIMKTVFNASLDGYVVWDRGHINQVSAGALKLFGQTSQTNFTNNNDELGISNAHLDKIFKKVLIEGRVREEQLLKSKDNTLIPCEIIHLPLNLHSGTCLLSCIRDLREQKKIEQELTIAKNQAEIAAKAKSEFLANMSHEIRTPLNGILGLTHLLQETNVNNQQKEYLTKIVDSFDTLQRVINDVLDFSKIDANKMVIEEIEFSLVDALNSVIDSNRPVAEQKGLTLHLELGTSGIDPVLIGDPVRFKQILSNLVGNAIKFTEKGSVEVKAEKNCTDAKQGRISYLFSVKDSGIGIAPDDMNALFKPFSQVDSSTTRKYGGTGLGLTISKKLTELMGGKIWCESKVHEGATFYFSINFRAPEESQNKCPSHLATVSSKLAEKLKGAKILLVEDNEVNQVVAQRLLEKAGLKVKVADNGISALKALEKEDFDLILMDIQMPEMDGLEATRRIRANPKYKNLPILALTAHAMGEDRITSLKAGMNDHITKPINLKELFTVLNRWLLK